MTQNPVQSKTDSNADNPAQPKNGAAGAEDDAGTDLQSGKGLQSDKALKESKSLPFWRVMISVFQAAFGVQTSENKERDFAEGKLLPFIVAAILFTAVFVGLLVFVVSLVLGEP